MKSVIEEKKMQPQVNVGDCDKKVILEHRTPEIVNHDKWGEGGEGKENEDDDGDE